MTTVDKPTSRAVYDAGRRMFQLLFRSLTKLETMGVENVPRQGACLMVINHLSIADPALICATNPRQCLMFVADKWKHVPVVSHISNTFGVIWVARGEVDRTALKDSLDFLKAGWMLGIAPEGQRSRSGILQAGKPGAAYLADRAHVPILPVAMMGTETISSNLKRRRRAPVKCVYGKPFRLPTNGRARADELDKMTDLIMCHLAALLEPQYRGAYADHPQLKELLAAQA